MGSDHLLKSSRVLKLMQHVNTASAPVNTSSAPDDNSDLLQSITTQLQSINAALQTLIAIQHKLLQHEISESSQEETALTGWTVVPRRDAADNVLEYRLKRSKD